jgi:hypothetical protein
MGVILRYNEFLKTYKTRGYRLRHLENYRHLFPIRSSPMLAGLVGDLISDGHLQGDPLWRMDFTSKDLKELASFNKRMKNLFGIDSKVRNCTSNKYSKSFNLGINCAPIARIFLKIGVPSGQKVLKNYNLPEWIKKDKECFREFCRHLFACEGTIMHEKNRKTPQVRFEHWKSEKYFEGGREFVKEICVHMEKYFQIKTTIGFPNQRGNRKDGIITRPIRVYILGDSVKKFFSLVGFSNHKQKSLKGKLLSSL